MKIFKLFISLFLILSISLINSIAAISVSDGSAFVTKAEFAADLNNLSNRMSSLENSLDAKIDSLVSSYLSRNGIWNGEKQTFLDYAEEKLWPNRWAKDSIGDEIVENDKVMICECSKSGLVNFSFQLVGQNTQAAYKTTHGTLIRFTSNNVLTDGAKGSIVLRCEIGERDNIYYSSNIFIGSLSNAVGKGAIVTFFVPSSLQNCMFFVNKGNKLWLRLVSVTEGGNFTEIRFVKTGYEHYYNPKMKFNFLNIY